MIVGAISYGTRLYMEEMDFKSSTSNSTALVVLNTRATGGYKSVSEMIKPNSEMPWGNHIAFMHVQLPKLRASLSSSKPLDFVFDARQSILRKRNSAAVYLNAILLQVIRKIRGSEVRFLITSLPLLLLLILKFILLINFRKTYII